MLDQVNNAQNLGGVVRTCAFYGIKNVVTNQVEQLYAPAAMRVACLLYTSEYGAVALHRDDMIVL